MNRRRVGGSLAGALRRRRLEGPVLLLAQVAAPLRPLLSDLATFASPVLEPMLGRRTTEQLESEAGTVSILDELAGDEDESWMTSPD